MTFGYSIFYIVNEFGNEKSVDKNLFEVRDESSGWGLIEDGRILTQ